MKMVRGVALKTQYVLAVATVVAFALGAGISQWAESRSQSKLLLSLHTDIAITTKLPRLEAQLRRLDLIAAQYLQTGKPEWLDERQRTLDELHQTQRDLEALFPEKRERSLLADLDRQLSEHFKAESRWIARKRAGRLSSAEVARILVARRNYEDILEIVLGMHDVDMENVATRLQSSQAAARRRVWGAFLVGLMISALLALGLSRYIISPISSLAAYAARWKPGQAWNCVAPAVSPEINSLFDRIKDLVERLNIEYRKQLDLNELKTKFVSLVSHEVNNALSVIQMASSSLEELDPERQDAKRHRMYHVIRRQLRVLSTAVANILNSGRLESGRLAVRKKKMDMARVIQESLDLVEILHEEKKLNVSLTLPDAPTPVYADPDALTLVATNLLTNAIKYTPVGGTIDVGIVHEGDDRRFIRVYVRDTGIGIRPEEQGKIFAGHYRSESGQAMAKGFGIGLSLAKNIIEAHGGRVQLESQVGKGSTFSFLLPLWLRPSPTELDQIELGQGQAVEG